MTRCVLLTLLILTLTLLPGCRSWDERNTGGVVLGTAAGAGLGALIGGAAGNWGKGAVIGAGAGALTGYVISESSKPRPRPPVRYYEPERRTVVYRDPPPSSADIRKADAEDLFQRGLWASSEADAEYWFLKSLDLYPTPAAYNNLGLLYLKQGKRDRARDMWERATRLDPSYRPAHENLERLDRSYEP